MSSQQEPAAGAGGSERYSDAVPPARPQGGLSPRPPAPPAQGRPAWQTWLVVVLSAVVLAIAAWFIATAFLPRWWSHRIGAMVDGSFTAGVFTGLTVGLAFTLVPLLVLGYAVRHHLSWGTRLVLALVAVVVAVPNLITLIIVYGIGSGAHAGRRTMDVDAPGFRGASLVGAVLAVVAAVAFWVSTATRRRRKRQLVELREQLKDRDDRGHDDRARDVDVRDAAPVRRPGDGPQDRH